MERLRIDGVELAYALRGGGSGRAVVILHGLIASSREWRGLAEALADAGCRVVSVDAPGHGASAAPRDPALYAAPRLAGLVDRLARALDLIPAVVFGHSWGGLIAEELAIAHPEDVEALVLVASGGGGPRAYVRPPDADAIFARETAVAFARGMEALWAMHQEEGLWASATRLPPKTQALLKARFCATSPEAYVFGNRSLGERRNTLADLSRLDVPALVVCGEHEEPLMAKTSRELAATLPRAQFEIIPNAWHSPHLENPRALQDVVLRFLAELEAPGPGPA